MKGKETDYISSMEIYLYLFIYIDLSIYIYMDWQSGYLVSLPCSFAFNFLFF